MTDDNHAAAATAAPAVTQQRESPDAPAPAHTTGGGGSGFRAEAAPPPGRAAGRTATVLLLVVSLVAAAGLRHLAVGLQRGDAAAPHRSAASGASLSGMDSYAIALLLGGLRGPLVMVLWINSEAQKTNRDLESVDTQIEWIRLLQPEFDAVHRFQMWNKAYNLSVQMVGLGNKYTTILNALDYGRNVDAERADNVNILKQMAMIYSAKLGNSYPERYYYRERLRRETAHREQAATGAKQGQPGFQRLQHDVLLDAAGNVLPQFVEPRKTRPAGLPADAEFYDGADLQFLPRFQPFRYGVSPYALGYNYHKRVQVLADATGEGPTLESGSVVDAQPGQTLKAWAEEEWERGRRLECKALGQPVPTERLEQEVATASAALDAKVLDAAALAEALYAYESVGRLTPASRLEFDRHLSKPEYLPKKALYAAQLDTLAAMRSLTAADAAYIRAMTAASEGPERAEFSRQAAQHYREAIREFGLITIRYFTDADVVAAVLPPGVTRANIGTGGLGSATAVTEEDVMRLLTATRLEIQRRGGEDQNAEDRVEYDTYIQRAGERLRNLEGAAT